jgi:predicted Zn-dependent protease
MRQMINGLLVFSGMAVLLCFSATPSHAGLKLGKIFKMSKSQELSIAKEMQTGIEKEPGLITKGQDYDLVQQTGKNLVAKNQLTQYEYKFFLTKDDEVNAFATPGGYIYVTQGLLKYMAYDKAMLAGVMAHELGHAKDRHVAKGYEKMLQGALGLGILSIALGKDNADLANVLFQGGSVVLLKYNRDQEEWADRDGVELAYKAGYDAYGLTRSLEALNVLYGSSDSVTTWLSNHPATADRVARTTRIAYAESGKHMGYVAIPQPPKDGPLYKLYGSGAPAKSKDEPGAKAGEIGTAERYDRGAKRTSPVK